MCASLHYGYESQTAQRRRGLRKGRGEAGRRDSMGATTSDGRVEVRHRVTDIAGIKSQYCPSRGTLVHTYVPHLRSV